MDTSTNALRILTHASCFVCSYFSCTLRKGEQPKRHHGRRYPRQLDQDPPFLLPVHPDRRPEKVGRRAPPGRALGPGQVRTVHEACGQDSGLERRLRSGQAYLTDIILALAGDQLPSGCVPVGGIFGRGRGEGECWKEASGEYGEDAEDS